jgi:rod shape-determining protein MreB and related proteins
MLGKKVGIDLGTASLRMMVKGEGVLTSEPSVIAVHHGDVNASVIGTAALDSARQDEELRLYRPLQGGAISDPVAARSLIHHVVTRAVGRQRIFKPDIVIAVMSALPPDQRRLLLEAAMIAGARTVYLLDAPIAAALGAGIPLAGADAHLVIDIGAGKTEVAVLALEGTIAGRCLAGHGGQRLAASIAEHVHKEHGVTLPAPVLEDIVESVARVGAHEERRYDVHAGGPADEQPLVITSTELASCLDAHVKPIATAIAEVLDDTPIELLDDLRSEGGLLCGGGALLEGIDRQLSALCGFTLRRDAEPTLCVVRGTGYASDNLDVLKRNFMYIR